MWETVLVVLGILMAVAIFPAALMIGAILGVILFYAGMLLCGSVILLLAGVSDWIRGWRR